MDQMNRRERVRAALQGKPVDRPPISFWRHFFDKETSAAGLAEVNVLETKVDVSQAFVDQCVMEAVHGTLTAVDAAKAKWWSAQAQNDIVDACVQLWGGYGYMNEYRVARAWRDARVTKIWAGSNEIMKELIGRDLGLDDSWPGASPRSGRARKIAALILRKATTVCNAIVK